jgi:hypothetical protein
MKLVAKTGKIYIVYFGLKHCGPFSFKLRGCRCITLAGTDQKVERNKWVTMWVKDEATTHAERERGGRTAVSLRTASEV